MLWLSNLVSFCSSIYSDVKPTAKRYHLEVVFILISNWLEKFGWVVASLAVTNDTRTMEDRQTDTRTYVRTEYLIVTILIFVPISSSLSIVSSFFDPEEETSLRFVSPISCRRQFFCFPFSVAAAFFAQKLFHRVAISYPCQLSHFRVAFFKLFWSLCFYPLKKKRPLSLTFPASQIAARPPKIHFFCPNLPFAYWTRSYFTI